MPEPKQHPTAEPEPASAAKPRRAGRREQDQPLIPARILNEFVYCPRLAYLEWVQKEWESSSDTVEGRHVHRRVDAQSGSLPASGRRIRGSQGRKIRRTVVEENWIWLPRSIWSRARTARSGQWTTSAASARTCLVKRTIPNGVQLCAQGLLLEEHGYRCREGFLYFAGSRERVRVEFDEELRALTLQSLKGLRNVVDAGQIPPPLDDSPKCPRCSLVGICLPDETNLLKSNSEPVRPISVKHTRALPVYVQSFRGKVAKEGHRLAITKDDSETTYARLADISQLVVMGNVYVTTPTLHELMRRNIPVTWQSYGGWFLGHTIGAGHANVELRTAQYKASFDDAVCLNLARGWVQAKIRNSRTLLRRNWRSDDIPDSVLTDLTRLADRAGRTRDMSTLLGIEGAAAARYFGHFNATLRSAGDGELFNMNNRNRRPPTDPINALLSFGYAMLTRAFVMVLSGTGFDPYRGFYHQPRYGRPALALDMMEPFRPLIVDSVVVTAINNGEVRPTDFVHSPIGVALSDTGRKRFLGTFERRLSQEVTHPTFGYRVEYRRLLEIQARLLGRHLMGEIPSYPNFVTR